jgi:thiamine kinase-like enzyme
VAVEPETLAAEIWPGRRLRVEPLGGGITNRNFKVSLDREAYVLRIGGKDTGLLGIDRRAEHAAAHAAAEAGAAPAVVAFDEDEGVLVTHFIKGRVPARDELRLADFVAALRPFHDGPPIPARFDSFRVVEAYAATAAVVPAAYERAKLLADTIERAASARQLRPCHNDLLSANFVFDGERLWIVDWEYAGMGDLFFDLANFSANHDLDQDEEDELLRLYFGERREADAAALTVMRFMSDFREAMWGVVQTTLSELDFDFAGYANRHFERLERTAASPRFGAAMHTLKSV